MQAIEYAEVYDGEPYFKPYRSESGVGIVNRAVVAVPGRSSGGSSWVTFRIVDNYRKLTMLVKPESTEMMAVNLILDEVTFQDDDYPKFRQLIRNLASGDLRGRAAEETVSVLLYELYAFGPGVKKWLPWLRQTFLENRKMEREARKKCR